MSIELISAAAEQRYFHPRQGFDHLANDHVPFDGLTGRGDYEVKALRECVDREGTVGIVGPRGGGKSSLIAHVCQRLPESHLPLRVPVSGVDDPTSTNVMATVALSQALNEIDLQNREQEMREQRADSVATVQSPRRVGGRLGGGVIPAEVNLELETLRTEFRTDRLAVDRLSGLDRLITILVSRRVRPVFVLEDTEAAIGGEDLTIAEGFLAGPVHALIHEVDAACLLAIQDVFEPTDQFRHLAASMTLVEIPAFEEERAGPALAAIVEHRLVQNEVENLDARAILDDAAMELLISFYGETGQNIRSTLAALQSATEYAAASDAGQVGAGHMRAAAADWRERGPR